MKALVQRGYGATQDVMRLREVDRPTPGDGEVLVRVRACGVGIGDWLIANGLPYIARPGYGLRKPKHAIAGMEFAGEVESVGEGVMHHQSGDDVFGWGNGALAEYVSVPQDAVTRKPASLTFEQAAAVPISAFAALQALRDAGGLKAGEDVLIIGASGAVGTFAVQIAKAMGAHVTAVCSTRNVDMVRSLGADSVIDYTQEGISQGGRRHDLILDLAGNRSLSTLRKALASTGTLVIVGGSGGRWLMGFGRTLRAIALSPFVRQRLRAFFSKPTAKDLATLAGYLEEGGVTPAIDRSYPLAAAREAIDHVGGPLTSGKTVVSV